jgi:hypothetical protein
MGGELKCIVMEKEVAGQAFFLGYEMVPDATEQRIQRPGDDERQRHHYSGKKKAHTRKTAIVVNERGRIRDVTHSTPGSQHDLKHAMEA